MWRSRSSGYLAPDSPKTHKRIWIDADVLGQEETKVAVRRKRNLFTAGPTKVSLLHVPSGELVQRWRIVNIDKVSEFVLKLDTLRLLDPDAYHEVHAITSDGGIGLLKQAVSNQVIEEAIRGQHTELLSPSVTIFYEHQQYLTDGDVEKIARVGRNAVMLGALS